MNTNKFTISKSDFEKSYFGIGTGFDLNPLFLFSKEVDNFIYVNLGLSRDAVDAWYTEAFLKKQIEVCKKTIISHFDEKKTFEFHPEFQLHLQSYYNGLTIDEQMDYREAFLPFIGQEQYALIYELKHQHSDKIFKLIFMTTEGLATYLSMSWNGEASPIIFSTIQTNVLELPDSSFSRWLAKSPSRPKIWLKGCEAGGIEGLNISTGESSYKWIEDYIKGDYICGRSYPSMRSEKRIVFAFQAENSN
jgi:hypothetical protein